ncbi:MAG: hypothetical protein U9R17_04240 [Thermodesulfobacteriota bacterium]|nr:hypothetical protein [Thermodesulfobacteriota bacterium]
MNSFTVKSYWKSYKELPANLQQKADAKFELWKENPFHPSLNFKCVNSEENIWSVRINMDYRALAVREGNSVIWYWVGDHNKYEQLLKTL